MRFFDLLLVSDGEDGEKRVELTVEGPPIFSMTTASTVVIILSSNSI